MENRRAGQDRLIIGISGASGVAYGLRALQLLRNAGIETHLVMTRTSELTLAYETTLKVADVRAAAMRAHELDDMSAPISSGSYLISGMIVVLDPFDVGDCDRRNLQSADPRRRRHPEGAPQARPDGS
jgi:4-hydroxy-3-polyprenylbenzoate decarboxylase